MTTPAPEREHAWLHQLVGDWSYEAEATMGPGQPPMKSTGEERVRSIGELWMAAEGRGAMPGGEMGTTIMTLGYDPRTKRFVGTWIGSMMTHLWIYDGALDAARKVLTLESEGPGFTDQSRMQTYRDVVEVRNRDHRVLTASVLGDDGQWTEFMTTHYRRLSPPARPLP